MILVEFDRNKTIKTEFCNREELDKYVVEKYDIDIEEYGEVPDNYERIYYKELEAAMKIDELADYYDIYAYGYWIE